jgi:large subunit ribosomal protein L4
MALSAPYIGRDGTVDLDEEVFGEPFHMPLVHETARAELAARRSGTASTLTRGEVAMTGAKAWRQKGTGRARAGALSTPQRYGGGVAFGPKPRRFTVKVNRKARRRALRCALSVHAARGSLAALEAADFDTPSTKRALEALADGAGERTLVVLAREGEDGATKSFRNLAGVTVAAVDAVGVADVVGARRLVVSTAALEPLTELARTPERRGARAPATAGAAA